MEPPASHHVVAPTVSGVPRSVRRKLGDRLWDIRILEKLSRADVAHHSGLTEADIGAIEMGKDVPRDSVIRAAVALLCDIPNSRDPDKASHAKSAAAMLINPN